MTDKRIVIDTTVLISAALWPTGYPRDAVFSALNQHTVLLSDATYQEISETLFRQKFNRYQSVMSRQRFLFLYQFAAETISVTTTIDDCRDPKDNKFLALALDGNADCIITGDDDLLSLHPYYDIAIVTAREAVENML